MLKVWSCPFGLLEPETMPQAPSAFHDGDVLKDTGQLFRRMPFGLGLPGIFSRLNSDCAPRKQAAHRSAGVPLGNHVRGARSYGPVVGVTVTA